MKMFDEFENDLRDVSDVRGLMKIMLANGIEAIAADDEGVKITVNTLGFIAQGVKDNCVGKEEGMYTVAFTATDGVVNAAYKSTCNADELEAKFGVHIERREVV